MREIDSPLEYLFKVSQKCLIEEAKSRGGKGGNRSSPVAVNQTQLPPKSIFDRKLWEYFQTEK